MMMCTLLALSVSGQTVKVGDRMVNRDGSEGIVFWISPDATYGWMVATEETELQFPLRPGSSELPTLENRSAAMQDTAGYGNTALLVDAFRGWGEYASLEANFKNGWYIPSLGQLRKLVALGCQLSVEWGSDVYLSSTWFNEDLFWTTTRWGETKYQGEVVAYFPVRTFSLVEYDTTLDYRWNTGAVTPVIAERPVAATTYEVTATTSVGCYAKAKQAVFVSSSTPATIDETICRGEVYRQYGIEATESGEYRGTLTGAAGCEQEIVVRLKVLEPVETFIEASVRDGEMYSGHGFAVWERGEHRQVWQRLNGCDSTVILQLTVLPAFTTDIYGTICEGGTYTSNGFSESVAGDHERLLKSVDGLDSLVTLHLTVNPVSRTEFPPVSVCPGETYSFMGEVLSQSGTYRHVLTNQWGCDSILELNLTVKETERDTIRAAICAGERYQAYGFDEAETGLYERVYADVHGCDSFVYLDLKVGDYFGGSLRVDLTDCTLHEYDFEADWESQAVIGGTRYVWDFGNGESRETETPSVRYAYADTGTYRLRLEVITPVDCRRERTGSVWVPYYVAELPVHIRPEYLDLAHPEIRLWTDSVAGMRYTWDFGDGSRGYGSSVEHTYVFQKHEAYEVILESLNEEDCPAQKRFMLHAYATIYPPNTITPNGDGVNDWFMRGYRVRIFNRNGVVVFQGEDGWDGQRDGQPVPEDTYFYEVYYLAPEGEKSKTGYVMVVR